MKKIFSIAIAIMAFVSCKKDPLPNPGNDTPPEALLTKIEQDAHNFVRLDYNSLNQLSLFKLVNGDIGVEASITYGEDKKPLQSNIEGFFLNYKYRDGRLVRVEYNTIDGVLENILVYSYTGNKISQTIMYAKSGDNYAAGLKTRYTYYASGDIRSMESYSVKDESDSFILDDSTVYEYDGKVNPFRGPDEVFYTFYINNSVHNISKETVYAADGRVKETRLYSFTYSSKGMPLTVVENTTYPDSAPKNRSMRYTYKQ